MLLSQHEGDLNQRVQGDEAGETRQDSERTEVGKDISQPSQTSALGPSDDL